MLLAGVSLLMFFGFLGLALIAGGASWLAWRRSRRPSLRVAALLWLAFAAWQVGVRLWLPAAETAAGLLLALAPAAAATFYAVVIEPRRQRAEDRG